MTYKTSQLNAKKERKKKIIYKHLSEWIHVNTPVADIYEKSVPSYMY